MKKINRLIFIISVSSLFFLVSGCTKKTAPVAEKTEDPVLSKQIFAVTNIAKMMQAKNYEAALYRMDTNFRTSHTVESFTELWNASTNVPEIQDFVISTENYDSLKFYKFIDVTFKSGTKKNSACAYGRYYFTPSSVMPSSVEFSTTAFKAIEKNYDLPLKEIFSDYFKIGCGLNGAVLGSSAITKPRVMELAKKEFSSCTMTNLMKPVYILNQQESIKNYENGNKEPVLKYHNIDQTLKFCMENKLPVRGHTLVWHTQTPEWFFREGYRSDGKYVSRTEMLLRLDSFIRQYMTYVQENYPNTVYCWDVVNEAVDPGKGDSSTDFMCRIINDNKDTGWYQTIGPDYPEQAFITARKYAAPDVKLFYNDYGAIDSVKQKCIYNLCKNLKEKGLIDGIGLQGYWDLQHPTLKEIESAINSYAELGLEIQLTEWSISAKADTEEAYNEQAQRYASVFRLLQKLDTQGGGNANITCVSFFGVNDKFNPGDNTNSRLFFADLSEKPVYHSIKDTGLLLYR